MKEHNLDYVKKTGGILIIRNPHKLALIKLKKFKRECDRRRIKVYISNNIKILFQLKSNELYLSSYNKRYFKHLKLIKTKLDIIGSAHNFTEIKQKINQGCSQIFLSRLFKTDYKFKKGWLGTTKFNLLTKEFTHDFVALGGIKKNNFKNLRNLKIIGCAFFSDKKKAGNFLPAFYKN